MLGLGVADDSKGKSFRHALMSDVRSGYHEKLSIENFVTLILGEQQVVVVGIADFCQLRGYIRHYHHPRGVSIRPAIWFLPSGAIKSKSNFRDESVKLQHWADPFIVR